MTSAPTAKVVKFALSFSECGSCEDLASYPREHPQRRRKDREWGGEDPMHLTSSGNSHRIPAQHNPFFIVAVKPHYQSPHRVEFMVAIADRRGRGQYYPLRKHPQVNTSP
ncbi:hypothetical protein BDN72DRAFT_526104 [Pluteus cervinus]|uniref:Uncharacterized protein n=1 Tax=Pluteus cervinus TaxID=181527 RepID=A0ACD3A476_9AGAR|nr:hypothetical protein BDN72DRAFT_526104 [Pluteus cervinus]